MLVIEPDLGSFTQTAAQTFRLRSHSHWKCVTLCGRYERFLNAANLTEEDEEYADSGGT